MSTQEKDYYRLLGVPRDAPDREIKKAYYELARKLHPDKAKTDEERNANSSQLALISKAYNTLKDAKKREEYDQQIRGRGPATTSAAPPAPAPQPPATSQGEPSPAQPAAPGTVPKAPTKQGANAQAQQQEADSKRAQALYQQKKAMAQKAFVKGMQFYKRQEHRQALSFFEVAATNDPESEAQYHVKYAQCLMRTKGSFTKAVEAAQRAIEMDPYNLEYKMLLAEIYEQTGVLSKARSIYEEILKWDETNSAAKNRLKLLDATSSGKGGSFLDKINSLFGKK